MKILVVGSDKVYAIENLYVQHLRAIGEEVIHFPAQSIFYDNYNRSLLNKVLFKAGISGIYRQINRQLIDTIKTTMPDLIWIFKGMEIFPDTLRWARSRGIKLVNYNPDNPFIFSGKGSGNKNVTDSVALFDLHFTYNLNIKEELERKFKIPVAYLPFGFEVPDDLYQRCREQEEIGKCCFLGNPDKDRASFILKMADAGLPFDLYGNDWNKFVQHANITIYSPIYGDDLWRTLYRYRVQLNLMRLHNPGSHNMRSFEVPGIGGILLAPRTNEHSLFFTEGKEVFLYSDAGEAIAQAVYLLGLSSADAGAVRSAARERSVISGYAYRGRAIFAFNKMKELLHG